MEFNDAFFEKLSTSPAVTGLCVDVANRVAEIARAGVKTDSGDYADGIVVKVKRQRRSVAVVEANDPKSLLIESKTGNLARAVRAVKRGAR